MTTTPTTRRRTHHFLKKNKDVADKVIELYKNNTSIRAISKIVGVSRATISDYILNYNKPIEEPAISVPGIGSHNQDYERCKTCGYLVLMPCVLCSLTEAKARVKRKRIRPADEIAVSKEELLLHKQRLEKLGAKHNARLHTPGPQSNQSSL